MKAILSLCSVLLSLSLSNIVYANCDDNIEIKITNQSAHNWYVSYEKKYGYFTYVRPTFNYIAPGTSSYIELTSSFFHGPDSIIMLESHDKTAKIHFQRNSCHGLWDRAKLSTKIIEGNYVDTFTVISDNKEAIAIVDVTVG